MHKIYNTWKTPLETYYVRTYKTLTGKIQLNKQDLDWHLPKFSSEVNYVSMTSTFQMFQIG